MKNRQRQKDALFSILIFCSAFAVNLLIQKLFTTQTLVPMIFVFGVRFMPLKRWTRRSYGGLFAVFVTPQCSPCVGEAALVGYTRHPNP